MANQKTHEMQESPRESVSQISNMISEGSPIYVHYDNHKNVRNEKNSTYDIDYVTQ